MKNLCLILSIIILSYNCSYKKLNVTSPNATKSLRKKITKWNRIFLIPIYQELGIPARLDQIEKYACYDIKIKAHEIDELYYAMKEYTPILIDMETMIIDPRIKIVEEIKKKEIYINRDLKVMSRKGDYYYYHKVKHEIVNRAIKVINKKASNAVRRWNGCLPPEEHYGPPKCLQGQQGAVTSKDYNFIMALSFHKNQYKREVWKMRYRLQADPERHPTH